MLLRRLIGSALRRARLRQGRTLREVAHTARVSMPYLSEVERGRKEVSSEILAAICAALGLPLGDLLDEVRADLPVVPHGRPVPAAPLAPRAPAGPPATTVGPGQPVASAIRRYCAGGTGPATQQRQARPAVRARRLVVHTPPAPAPKRTVGALPGQRLAHLELAAPVATAFHVTAGTHRSW